VAEPSFCAVFGTGYKFSKNIEMNIIDMTKLLPLMKHVKQDEHKHNFQIDLPSCHIIIPNFQEMAFHVAKFALY
jgi:hypothetical protein